MYIHASVCTQGIYLERFRAVRVIEAVTSRYHAVCLVLTQCVYTCVDLTFIHAHIHTVHTRHNTYIHTSTHYTNTYINTHTSDWHSRIIMHSCMHQSCFRVLAIVHTHYYSLLQHCLLCPPLSLIIQWNIIIHSCIDFGRTGMYVFIHNICMRVCACVCDIKMTKINISYVSKYHRWIYLLMMRRVFKPLATSASYLLCKGYHWADITVVSRSLFMIVCMCASLSDHGVKIA